MIMQNLIPAQNFVLVCTMTCMNKITLLLVNSYSALCMKRDVIDLNYPGLPLGVLGCPRISVGDGEGVGFGVGVGVGDRGLGTS